MSADGDIKNPKGGGDIWVLFLNKQGEIIWEKSLGGSSWDWGYSIIEMDNGGFVVGGITWSQDILTPKGKNYGDYLLLRLDISGNIVWSKRYGGSNSEDLNSIIKTNDGGVLVVGATGSTDGDVTNNHGEHDAWIVKLDSDGNMEWQKSIGGSSSEWAYSAAQASDNSFLIVGATRSINGDIPNNQGGEDCWIAKISYEGNLIWIKTVGGTLNDNFKSIKKTQNEGFIVLGSTDSKDGDFENISGEGSALVVYLDANGDFIWKKLVRCNMPSSIAETSDGGFVITGIASSGAYGVYHCTITKFNNTGQATWSKILNNYNPPRKTSVKQTIDGGFIVAGCIRSKILTDYSDYIVTKFSPEQLPQSDVSDSVFSIVAPTIASRNVDMGRVILGAYKDSLITSFIENKSRFECKIKDIRLTGADAADFYVISNKQFTLAGGEKKAIEFHFKPGALGARNALIEIESQDSILTQSIIGEGVQPQIQLSTKLIDFGVVEVTQSKDTVLFLIKNLDKNPITITNTKLLGPDYKQFEIVAGGGTFTLQPDSLRELKLAFNPVYVGRTSSDIGFYFNGPGSPARAQLFGRGIGGIVYCTEDSAAAGEKATINLCLGNVKINSVNKLASSFRASIQYEKSLLAPVDRSLVKSVGKDSAYLEIHGNIGKDSVLYPIEFIAGLGANESTSIDITDFKWLDETGKEIEYDTETESGSFKLLGVCREGGARLVNPTGKADILSLAPNPATDEITVTVNKIEEGESFIVIYNSLGAEAGRIALSGAPLGEKEVKISLASYPRGAYFVRFQTPTVSTGRMVIFE
ncbi:MAG: choice-of-anchor D domain-containing protein [Chloroflexota bacterium]